MSDVTVTDADREAVCECSNKKVVALDSEGKPLCEECSRELCEAFTKADIDAGDEICARMSYEADDVDSGFPIYDRFTDGEIKKIIANAMTPERERAARVEKALREIIHDLSGVRNWFLAEQSTDANEMAEIVKSSMGSARAALGEE